MSRPTTLDAWARRIERWRVGLNAEDAVVVEPPGAVPRARRRDVFVYFDNDVKVRAPRDAMKLAARFGC